MITNASLNMHKLTYVDVADLVTKDNLNLFIDENGMLGRLSKCSSAHYNININGSTRR